MRNVMVFSLASIGALTLLAGTAAAGAAGWFFYSSEGSCSTRSEMAMPGGVQWRETIPAPIPLDPSAEGVAVPVPVPAGLDRDEELLALKAQLAAALQRIAELETQSAPGGAPSAPAPTRAGGDF